MTPYTETFRLMQPTHDPRHIEAFIRVQYGTLDHLDRRMLEMESAIAAECITVGGLDEAEALAQSFGL